MFFGSYNYRQTKPKRRRAYYRPELDLLEDRLAPAVWVPAGPSPIINGQVENIPSTGAGLNAVAGAIHALALHPTNADVAFLGSVNGGIFRSTNFTSLNPTYTAVTDQLTGTSTGALVFDATDPNILVAGVGRYSSFGRTGGPLTGLIRSTDGGSTWTELGVLAGRNISGIAAMGSTIVVASNTFSGGIGAGVYRSTDSGATFTFISGTNGLTAGQAFDLIVDPTNTNRLYVGIGGVGIFRSLDQGATWVNISAGNAALNAVVTNATNNNIEFAVSPVNGRLYVGAILNNQPRYIGFTDNQGLVWVSMDLPATVDAEGTHSTSPAVKPGAQGEIHFSIAADPLNVNYVYIGGDRQPFGFPNSIGANDFTGRLFRGDTTVAPTSPGNLVVASAQWEHLTHTQNAVFLGGGTASRSAPHADSRDMAFRADGQLIEVDDGGVYRRTNPQSNTGDWFSMMGVGSGLQVTEMHDIAYDNLSNIIISGNQDAGTTFQIAPGSMIWNSRQVADGGDVVVDNLVGNANSIRYSSIQNLGLFVRDTYNASGTLVATVTPSLTGFLGDVQFVTPLAVNEVVPNRLIIGGAVRTYESFNNGDSVSVIGAAVPVNPGAIAYGASLGLTPNAEALFVGSGNRVFGRVAAGNLVATTALPGGATTVTDVEMNPVNFNTVIAIDNDQVFISFNAGGVWNNITGNLSDQFLSAVEYIPNSVGGADVIVVGGAGGVYHMYTDTFGVWSELGTGMPNAIVRDMDYDRTDDILVVGTQGRGAWTYPAAAATLFGGSVVITETGGATTVTEGSITDTYTVQLNRAPAGTVLVTLNAGSQLSVSQTVLSFNATNWNLPQIITVTAVDDTQIEGTHSGIILHTTSSNDSSFNNLSASLTVTIIDNEVGPGIRIVETGGGTTVTEGGPSDTYNVLLNTMPTANVTVTLTFGAQITAAPTVLTFTSGNWNVAQTVTVSAVDDAFVEASFSAFITHTASSTDANYNNRTATLTVTVNDNDRAESVVVSELDGVTAVAEGGAADSYLIVLRAAPSADVTITLTTVNSQVNVAPATLTFTPANWFIPQTVNVTAVDDGFLEGTHQYLISHTAVSVDTRYNLITIRDVIVTITDNDTPAGLRVSRPARWRYNRAGDFYQGEIIVRNSGTGAAVGPLYLVVRSLPNNVTVLNALSFTPKGSPYLVIPNASIPGQSTVRVPIQIRKPIDYPLGVYDFGFALELTNNLNDAGAVDPSGYVYADANKNGKRDPGEVGIPNVVIQLTGTTYDGQVVNDVAITDNQGYYNFLVLPGTYSLTQIHPAGWRDGLESVGNLGGIAENDRISNIVVKLGDFGTDYNFGEFINHTPSIAVQDYTIDAGDGPFSFDLSATDSDGDSLIYTARLSGPEGHAALAYQWKQQHGLTFKGKYTVNKLRLGLYEKWIPGADRKSYFILQNGDFYQYGGRGTFEQHIYLGRLSDAYYADPSLIWDAPPPAAEVSVSGRRVTVTPRAGFAGTLTLEAAAHDGLASDAKTVRLTVNNQATQLAAIAAQQMLANRTLGVNLQATDGDGDALTYSAHLADLSDVAWQLKQTYGFVAARSYKVNGLKLAYQEKWIKGANRTTFLLLPDGRLYLYNGTRSPLSRHTLVARLNESFYFNPNLLTAATPPVASIAVSGNRLAITPRAGFTGSFNVVASATDRVAPDTESFQVNVINTAPQLADLADITIGAGTTRLALPGSDSDGDPLTYEAFLVSGDGLAFELKQSLGLRPASDYTVDKLGFGHQEKWIPGAGSSRYLLTPDGNLYLWNRRYESLNGQTPIANLGIDYYNNLDLLWASFGPTIGLQVTGNQLSITPKFGYRGTFTVSVQVNDGAASMTKSFRVTVA